MKFHVDRNGNPASCSADTRACPLGGKHFENMRDAQVFVAKQEAVEQMRQFAYVVNVAEENSLQNAYVQRVLSEA